MMKNETAAEKRQQAFKQRRIADREARRTRRRQFRLDRGTNDSHEDGLSSDDEESNSDLLKYSNDRSMVSCCCLLLPLSAVSGNMYADVMLIVGAIINEANVLFEDVAEEFMATRSVLDRFMEWKNRYTPDYNDAFVGLCLPKLLSPLIKLSLVSWDPFEVRQCKPIHREASIICTIDTVYLLIVLVRNYVS